MTIGEGPDEATPVIELPERTAYRDLTRVVERRDARVHQGVKLSNIVDPPAGPDFEWATRAEIDLLVRDDNLDPLFAMEVDGRHHVDNARQARRDRLKDRLLREAGIDLLRVTSQGALTRHGRGRLVAYLADLWFTARAFHEQQQAGDIPPDEPFCHFAVLIPDRGSVGYGSLAPDMPIRARLLAEHAAGRLPVTAAPATWIRYRRDVGLVDACTILPVGAEHFLAAEASVGIAPIPGVVPGDIAAEATILELGAQWQRFRDGEPEARHVRDLPQVLPVNDPAEAAQWRNGHTCQLLTAWLVTHIGEEAVNHLWANLIRPSAD